MRIIIHLDDYCDRGEAWKIWNNMELIDASYPDDHYDGDLSWINFQGRWGNIQKIVSQIIFSISLHLGLYCIRHTRANRQYVFHYSIVS